MLYVQLHGFVGVVISQGLIFFREMWTNLVFNLVGVIMAPSYPSSRKVKCGHRGCRPILSKNEETWMCFTPAKLLCLLTVHLEWEEDDIHGGVEQVSLAQTAKCGRWLDAWGTDKLVHGCAVGLDTCMLSAPHACD